MTDDPVANALHEVYEILRAEGRRVLLAQQTADQDEHDEQPVMQPAPEQRA